MLVQRLFVQEERDVRQSRRDVIRLVASVVNNDSHCGVECCMHEVLGVVGLGRAGRLLADIV